MKLEEKATAAQLLGMAESQPTSGDVARRLARVIPFDAVPESISIRAVDYPFGSPATGGLFRISGVRSDGREWSVFCKLIQHLRHWPRLDQLPPPIAAQMVEEFPWRSELDLWAPEVLETMPAEVRAPTLYSLIDLPDDKVAIWMEDITEDPSPWDVGRFVRAARALGRWNARRATPEVLAACPYPPGYGLRKYAEDAVSDRGIGPLRSDELWSHPWLSPHEDLRRALLAQSERIPDLLEQLESMPQAIPHGDASPQNLLVPVDDPNTFVAIDISFQNAHALGFDLGQLLIGLVHAGLTPAANVTELAEPVLSAYCEGLAAEGCEASKDDVRFGFRASLLLRSGFDGFAYGSLDADRETFDQRIDLARAILALNVPS